MPTLLKRRRSMCSDCGQRCFVEPVEAMFHVRERGLHFWRWVSLTLCPICRLARHDWWLDKARGGQRVPA